MGEIRNIHPGEILLREFLKPMKISQNKLAKAIDVQPIRISEIVRGLRNISYNTGLRLDKFFGMSEGFWMRIQLDYDMRETKKKIKRSLAKIKTHYYQPTTTA